MALMHCGESPLLFVDDEVPQRYKLDAIYNNDMIKRCLEQHTWGFATRTQQIDYDPTINPVFGYKYAFRKPVDFIRSCDISADEFFSAPFLNFQDDPEYWFCELTKIYVRYVSIDDKYGNDLSIWSGSFCSYVEYYLASKLAIALTKSESMREELNRMTRVSLSDAQNKDAVEQPTKFLPMGRWATARLAGSSSERYRRGY